MKVSFPVEIIVLAILLSIGAFFGIKFNSTSKTTIHCDKMVIVPNTIGMDISDGRNLMFEFGFRPIINKDFSETWESKYYSGITELVGCSNGITWCNFEYENDRSRVVLRTLGQDEIIEDEVQCKLD